MNNRSNDQSHGDKKKLMMMRDCIMCEEQPFREQNKEQEKTSTMSGCVRECEEIIKGEFNHVGQGNSPSSPDEKRSPTELLPHDMWTLDPRYRHPDARLSKSNTILRNPISYGRISACGTVGMTEGVHTWRVTMERGHAITVGVCDRSRIEVDNVDEYWYSYGFDSCGYVIKNGVGIWNATVGWSQGESVLLTLDCDKRTLRIDGPRGSHTMCSLPRYIRVWYPIVSVSRGCKAIVRNMPN